MKNNVITKEEQAFRSQLSELLAMSISERLQIEEGKIFVFDGDVYKISDNLLYRPLGYYHPLTGCSWATDDSSRSLKMYLKREDLRELTPSETESSQEELAEKGILRKQPWM